MHTYNEPKYNTGRGAPARYLLTTAGYGDSWRHTGGHQSVNRKGGAGLCVQSGRHGIIIY